MKTLDKSSILQLLFSNLINVRLSLSVIKKSVESGKEYNVLILRFGRPNHRFVDPETRARGKKLSAGVYRQFGDFIYKNQHTKIREQL